MYISTTGSVPLNTTCTRLGNADATISGYEPGTHRELYHVHTDVPVPAAIAIDAARALAPPDNLPERASTYFATGFSGYQFTDNSIFALDFDARPLNRESDHPTDWLVEVTYRSRVWGMHEHVVSATTDPWNFPAEVKWEWVDELIEEPEGRLVTNEQSGTLASSDIMKNTAGEPFPPAQVTRRKQIFRARFATTDINTNYDFNDGLGRSVNSDTILLIDRSVPPHHAKFESIEQTEWVFVPQGTQSVLVYLCDLRIEVGDTPFYETYVNEGSYFLVNGTQQRVHKDIDGFNIPTPYQLDENGGLITPGGTDDVINRKFLVPRPVAYQPYLAASRVEAV